MLLFSRNNNLMDVFHFGTSKPLVWSTSDRTKLTSPTTFLFVNVTAFCRGESGSGRDICNWRASSLNLAHWAPESMKQNQQVMSTKSSNYEKLTCPESGCTNCQFLTESTSNLKTCEWFWVPNTYRISWPITKPCRPLGGRLIWDYWLFPELKLNTFKLASASMPLRRKANNCDWTVA